MLDNAPLQITNVHFIWSTKVALAHNADRPLFNPQFWELVAYCLQQGLQSSSVRVVSTGIQAGNRLNILGRALLSETLLEPRPLQSAARG